MFLSKDLTEFGADVRPEQFLALYAEEMARGFDAMKKFGKKGVSVFGTARRKPGSLDYQQAYRLGHKIVTRSKKRLCVIQGGGPGAMEGSAHGARDAGGEAVSVCLKLPHEEKPHPYGNVNLQHRFFPTRKTMFIENSVGFIHVKGGFGTLDELSEVLVHVQCRMATKVPVYLIGTRFWNPLDVFIKESMLAEGLINEEDIHLYNITDDEDEAVEGVVSHWEKSLIAA